MKDCITDLPLTLRRRIAALAIDGTSGTLVACDENGQPLAPALMYNDSRAAAEALLISKIAPANSGAHGASSGLAKALWLQKRHHRMKKILHQADWIAAQFTEKPHLSDENNALKTGYDLINHCWPDWIFSKELPFSPALFPKVFTPGSEFGTITAHTAMTLGLPSTLKIHAGTTDSIAAFLASGALKPGDAVTSLGSTLAIKIISSTPIFAPEYGIYSHRLGAFWLAGGASNSGGAALLRYFSAEEIATLTPRLNPGLFTGLSYYPLPSLGERFPVADPLKASLVTPRIEPRLLYFQGMLEGIAEIEREAYAKLHALGAEQPQRIFTLGGGAKNSAWTQIRQQKLGCEMLPPKHLEAACGTAQLAMQD